MGRATSLKEGLLAIERTRGNETAAFPFSVPAIHSLERLDLSSPVTFFVGENGSGEARLDDACGTPAAAGGDR